MWAVWRGRRFSQRISASSASGAKKTITMCIFCDQLIWVQSSIPKHGQLLSVFDLFLLHTFVFAKYTITHSQNCRRRASLSVGLFVCLRMHCSARCARSVRMTVFHLTLHLEVYKNNNGVSGVGASVRRSHLRVYNIGSNQRDPKWSVISRRDTRS